MGLDFGTSSTKVVISDMSLKAAYAVPLVDGVGTTTYLLPSAVVETPEGIYVLAGTGKRHADLKLAMLAQPTSVEACARVCGFLALVIRSARAWLFEAKRDQYLRSELLWALAIGQPAGQAISSASRQHFEHLAAVAWHLAGLPGPIAVELAESAWRDRAQLDLGEELEVRPVAELSAQIHGFVSSSHFDARQPNIYLLVDVGAGTVDASVFHVRKDRTGTPTFSLFTHSVEPLGAANLNRCRVDWWKEHLATAASQLIESNPARSHKASHLTQNMDGLRLPTEYSGTYPEHFTGYLHGVDVALSGGAKSPDEMFQNEVRNQVAGRVLWKAWDAELLSQEAVRDMPFFLCGGGGRHPLFASLKSRLQKTPNCTWLTAKHKPLALPANLQAPGVAHADYDRLSVAYGLSQLRPGAFEAVAAMQPTINIEQHCDWSTSPVDKSVC